MIIRKAKEEDARKIGICHYDCWQETYRGLIVDEYLDKMNKDENMDRFEHLFESIGKYQYVVEEDKEIIGFFDISPARDKYANIEVRGLYLRKAYQKKGYGREIFCFIREKVRNESFYLWCLKDNPTCGFYLYMGGKLIDYKEVIIGGFNEIEVCYLFSNDY